ncbi:MAG: prepilin peptidase [Rickettsiales bacterium]
MTIIIYYLLFSMFAVMYYDSSRFIIPNWLVGSLLILYPAAFYISEATIDWQMDLLGMLIVFVIGFAIFAIRMMGGGDIKLIIVLALWVGWNRLAEFGFNFAVLGGLLSIILLLIRAILPKLLKNKKLPKIFRKREPVPYGLAIAGAFLLMMFAGEVAILSPNFLSLK